MGSSPCLVTQLAADYWRARRRPAARPPPTRRAPAAVPPRARDEYLSIWPANAVMELCREFPRTSWIETLFYYPAVSCCAGRNGKRVRVD